MKALIEIMRDTHNIDPTAHLVVTECIGESVCLQISDSDREIFVNKEELDKALSIM